MLNLPNKDLSRNTATKTAFSHHTNIEVLQQVDAPKMLTQTTNRPEGGEVATLFPHLYSKMSRLKDDEAPNSSK